MEISGRSLKLWSVLGVLAITALITSVAFSQNTTANVEVVAVDSDNSVLLRATGLEAGEQYAIVISDVAEDDTVTAETGQGEVNATQAWQLGTFIHAEGEDAVAQDENVVVHRVSIPEQLAGEEMLRIGYVLMSEQEQDTGQATQTEEATEEATAQATEAATQTDEATEEATPQATEGATQTEQATEEATAQATEGATQTEEATEEATPQATEAATQTEEATAQATEGATQTEEATEEGGDQGAQAGGQISVNYVAWTLFDTTDQQMAVVEIDEELLAYEGIPATGGAGQAQETPGATPEATQEATPEATATDEAGDEDEDEGEETGQEGLPGTGLSESAVERGNRRFVALDEMQTRMFGDIDTTMNRNYSQYDNSDVQGRNQCGDQWIVSRGEWLGLVVINCDVPLDALLAANPQIQNPNLVFPGEIILIPEGEFEVGEILNPDTGNAFAAPVFVSVSGAEGDNQDNQGDE